MNMCFSRRYKNNGLVIYEFTKHQFLQRLVNHGFAKRYKNNGLVRHGFSKHYKNNGLVRHGSPNVIKTIVWLIFEFFFFILAVGSSSTRSDDFVLKWSVFNRFLEGIYLDFPNFSEFFMIFQNFCEFFRIFVNFGWWSGSLVLTHYR